jgi:hypothetical protein
MTGWAASTKFRRHLPFCYSCRSSDRGIAESSGRVSELLCRSISGCRFCVSVCNVIAQSATKYHATNTRLCVRLVPIPSRFYSTSINRPDRRSVRCSWTRLFLTCFDHLRLISSDHVIEIGKLHCLERSSPTRPACLSCLHCLRPHAQPPSSVGWPQFRAIASSRSRNADSIASKSAFFEKDCRTKHTA